MYKFLQITVLLFTLVLALYIDDKIIHNDFLSIVVGFLLLFAVSFIANKIVIAFHGPCPLDLNIENRHKIELINITKRYVSGTLYFNSSEQVTQFSVPPHGRYEFSMFNYEKAKVTITGYPGFIIIHAPDSEEPSGTYVGPFS